MIRQSIPSCAPALRRIGPAAGASFGRHREIAVRAAVGAGRGRLVRQLLAESTVIALAGGALGLFLARWAVRTLIALAPNGRIPRLDSIVVDGWVLAFATIASLTTAVLFGLAPALRL